jgi:hypothetical protein
MSTHIEIVYCELCGKNIKIKNSNIQGGEMVDDSYFCNKCLDRLESGAGGTNGDDK